MESGTAQYRQKPVMRKDFLSDYTKIFVIYDGAVPTNKGLDDQID